MDVKLLIIVLAVALNLMACSSHHNPLAADDQQHVVSDLIVASKSAEKSLHIFRPPGGYVYSLCLSEKYDRNQCKQLFRLMLLTLKVKKKYAALQYQDLIDQTVWLMHKKNYNKIQFDTI